MASVFEQIVRDYDFPPTIWNLLGLDSEDCRFLMNYLPIELVRYLKTSVETSQSHEETYFYVNGTRIHHIVWFSTASKINGLHTSNGCMKKWYPRIVFCQSHKIAMELDYYIRSACIPKHSFIWSDQSNGSIRFDDFARIICDANSFNRCRYTFAPYLPWLCDIGTINKLTGKYTTSLDDNIWTYGSRSEKQIDALYSQFNNINFPPPMRPMIVKKVD